MCLLGLQARRKDSLLSRIDKRDEYYIVNVWIIDLNILIERDLDLMCENKDIVVDSYSFFSYFLDQDFVQVRLN